MVHHYKGNDGDKSNGGMAHYNDLREIYARQMEYHGCGFALFQPISAQDMTPPCAGYFDRNGDWNLICRLSTSPQAQKPLHIPGDAPAQPFAPLKYDPVRSSSLNIEWQAKTSQDVSAHEITGGGQTPDNLPAGADVKISYKSKAKFGAVLMTLRPITLTAYNDERLFSDWLNNNRALLYTTYGVELKKYGLWVVSRTYTAPGCSINAWQDNSKESVVSLKAKASMLGELADGEVNWNDKMIDKDWSHYKAKEGDGVVVFMDGIEVPKSDWWIEGVRQKLGRSPGPNRSHSNSPDQQVYYDPSTILPAQTGDLIPVQKRQSPNSQLGGYLAPPGRQSNQPEYYTGRPNATAKADIGVMPTWSENTAGPNTHGGTQNIVPNYDASGGYTQSPIQKVGNNSPIQKAGNNRQDSGLAGVFMRMQQGSPLPWEGIESPVATRQGTALAQSAPPTVPAVAPPPPQQPAAAQAPAPAQPTAQQAPAPAQAPAPVPSSQPAEPSTPALKPSTPHPQAAPSTPGTRASPPTPAPKAGEDAPAWQVSAHGWVIDFQSALDDEQTLKDAGVTALNRRSVSIRRASNASSIRPVSIAESFRSGVSVGRTKSLRRETRSISGESMKEKDVEGVMPEGHDHRRASAAV